MTLTDFLIARIADDEATARRVQAVGSCEPAYRPARVLAECEAKRSIVEDHPRCDVHDLPGAECDACQTCRDGSVWPCPTLLHLAAVYADHPDYRDDWRY